MVRGGTEAKAEAESSLGAGGGSLLNGLAKKSWNIKPAVVVVVVVVVFGVAVLVVSSSSCKEARLISCQTSSMDLLLGVPGDEGDELEHIDFESELELPLFFLLLDGHMVVMMTERWTKRRRSLKWFLALVFEFNIN